MSERLPLIPRDYYQKDGWLRMWQGIDPVDALLQCGKALRPYGLKITVRDEKDDPADHDWWFKVEYDDPDD